MRYVVDGGASGLPGQGDIDPPVRAAAVRGKPGQAAAAATAITLLEQIAAAPAGRRTAAEAAADAEADSEAAAQRIAAAVLGGEAA